jgi:hypothetical protein
MIDLNTVDIHSEEFDRAIGDAWTRARLETLAAGIPVFYLETGTGLNVMEMPGGRKFEIRWLPGRPANENYEILREIVTKAA